MNLKVAQNYIRQTGAKVDVASSGTECLSLIYREKYDIVFLDHMMPEMDGVQTLNAMKLLPRIQKKHKLFLRKVHWKNAFHI